MLWLILGLTSLFGQELGIVQVSAVRQDSLSKLQTLKQLHLFVYDVSMCSTHDTMLPGGRVVKELADYGIPVESSYLIPFILMRGKNSSLLGMSVNGGEYGAGMLSMLAAAGVISIAGPLAVVPPALAFTVPRLKGKQDQYFDLLIPLIPRVLKVEEKINLPYGVCDSRFVISSLGDKHIERFTLTFKLKDPLVIISQSEEVFRPQSKLEIDFITKRGISGGINFGGNC